MRIIVDLQSAQGFSRNRGIGRYSLALAQAMARAGRDHEIWIALNGLFPATLALIRRAFEGLVPPERIVVWRAAGPVAACDPANTWRRETAELLREQFLSSLKPDLVHVSSVFEGWAEDVVTSIAKGVVIVPTAATLYDLIPYVFRNIYLSDKQAEQWYYKKLQWVKNAGVVLAISEHTRQEAIERLGLPEDRIVSISAGVDPQFRAVEIDTTSKARLRAKYGLGAAFVMYTGAIDPRKNVEGLIKAFALLPPSLRKEYQLVIVGHVREDERGRLAQLARREGLRRGDVVLTGLVPDGDLIALYNLCTLFVFPSLYEGFGLPLLEAMACGAPVIASNTSSLPEVVGWEKALFDPKRPKAIAEKMQEALTGEAFRQALREYGLGRAKRFSWDESARRALTAFEAVHGEHTKVRLCHSRPQLSKPKLAYLSPLPPIRSRVADYSRELLPELDRYYQIELIVDQPEVSDPWLTACFPIRTVEWFEKNSDRYDRVLYHLGNSEFHRHMFDLLKEHPGCVVLHDFYLSGVLHWMDHTGYAPGVFRRELYRSHGWRALAELAETGEEGVMSKYPCNLNVIEGANGIIVHSRHATELADQWYGEGTGKQWWVLPDAKEAPGPQQLGEQYHQAIETFYKTGRHARRRHLIRAIAQQPIPASPTDKDLLVTAASIAANQGRSIQVHQLLVDVSSIAQQDLRTGIQRVTRGHLRNLLRQPPEGWRVEPVYACPPATYRYARDFTARCLNLPPLDLSDECVEVMTGDIFLGLDWAPFLVPHCTRFFADLKSQGALVYFLLYDLIPLHHPEWVPPELHSSSALWLETIAEVSDGVICGSRTVANDFLAWLDSRRPPRLTPLRIGYAYYGADLEHARALGGTSAGALRVMKAVRQGSLVFLMVGTVDPRKGYAQTLGAFESLWQGGVDVCLVIVGKPGWMMEPLVKRLRNHPERDKRLFWLEEADDETLLKLYRSATVFLMASQKEGYDVPLVEAARHGLPIIARDVPEFREACGEHAFYFRGDKPEDLAEAITTWLKLYRERQAPSMEGMRVLTWEESTKQLVDVILGGNWYRTWEPKS